MYAFGRDGKYALTSRTCRLIMRGANGSDILITLHYYRYAMMGTWFSRKERRIKRDFRATIRFNAPDHAYGHYCMALLIVRRRTIELAIYAYVSRFSSGRESCAYIDMESVRIRTTLPFLCCSIKMKTRKSFIKHLSCD